MQTFDAFAVGDKIFVPSVRQKDVATTCPDCLGEKLWTITMPSGVSKTIDCPRCDGGNKDWLRPRRYERTLEISEAEVSEVSIRTSKAYKSEEIRTRIDYNTVSPYIGNIGHGNAYRSIQEAEEAGKVLLAQEGVLDEARFREERERTEKRAGQDILTALQAKANEQFRDLDFKIDQLKEKMLEAIQHPTLYGPKMIRAYTGGPQEITSQAMADWLSGLFSEADLEGWSEQELQEALCHC